MYSFCLVRACLWKEHPHSFYCSFVWLQYYLISRAAIALRPEKENKRRGFHHLLNLAPTESAYGREQRLQGSSFKDARSFFSLVRLSDCVFNYKSQRALGASETLGRERTLGVSDSHTTVCVGVCACCTLRCRQLRNVRVDRNVALLRGAAQNGCI